MYDIDKTKIKHQVERANKIATTLNKTVNFNTFFTLYKKLEFILIELSKFEIYGIYGTDLPSQDLRNLYLVRGNAEKALINRFISFYGYENLSSIIPYINEFLPENCEYINSLHLTPNASIAFKKRKPAIDENIFFFLSLQEIRDYWKEHPIQYGENYDNIAKPDEYLFYGKILMLSLYEKATSVREDNDFPNYFTYECHISKPKQLLILLIEEGYITEANSRELLSLYTVQNLKTLAEHIGCKKTGTKYELITRILQNLDDSSFLYSTSNKFYSLSDKGIVFLQKNFDYIHLHKNWEFNISLFEYNNQRMLDINHRFEDVSYSLLIKRIKKSFGNNELLGIKRDFYSLYKISLIREDFPRALFFYICSLYLATCCIDYVHLLNNDFELEHHDSSAHIVYSTSMATNLAGLQKYYSTDIVDYLYNSAIFPPSFLSKYEFKQSIENIFCQIVFDFEYYNNLIFYRLEEYLDTVY